MINKTAKLILKDGSIFEGTSFGVQKSISGEVVFATGMVGYPEALTDPSFLGQILVLTYPLIGNYGVPEKELWESKKIQVSGLVVCNYIDTPSHHAMQMTLQEWLKKENIPALEIKDTRILTQKLRDEGVSLGKIIIGNANIKLKDPNLKNLVDEVSTKKVMFFGEEDPSNTSEQKHTVVILDCGVKQNIIRELAARKFNVVVVPWDTDVTKLKFSFSAVVISNGPGDPQKAKITIGFKEWFYNANDRTNEGIIHKTLPFMSVQFHPESSPGPLDTDWIFDYFFEKAVILKRKKYEKN